MKYFRQSGHEDHQDEAGICAGFEDTDDYPAPLQMFDRCQAGAEILLKEEQEMAFYLVRHCAELGLKLGAFGLSGWREEHNLMTLLNRLPESHPARGSERTAKRFRSMLQEIARADKSGQAGRYPFLTSGRPAFDGVCHISRDDLARFLADAWHLLRRPWDEADVA